MPEKLPERGSPFGLCSVNAWVWLHLGQVVSSPENGGRVFGGE